MLMRTYDSLLQTKYLISSFNALLKIAGEQEIRKIYISSKTKDYCKENIQSLFSIAYTYLL